ncbi:hypothetical protein OM076_21015 [Solirubrobacter ginsenosidimutans]|uniref:Uncharacterized protein n=1 Tax=Solirubrobacter ginsenosidimutans TaxID=490573 RepID=A0A9X3S2W9_9ACTN|nr:hypothetical protein [Solirubrobacter ginsenosidimutans]MDA0162767.1 hypothetical protein [Solirubrobacter ginsenosidimutans]
MKRMTWAALSAALLVPAIAAPMASADSIAYVNKTDGNVYLSTPDGSRQYQVTTTGGYSDVSQADDGTMIALKGVRLNKLARDGTVLADFDTPVSDTRDAPAKTFYGPFDPAISPDGTKVAYTYYYMTQSQNPGCFPPTCVVAINEAGTGYSYSDRQTSWQEPGLGYHSGWRHPSWVDNDMTMISNPSHLPNRDIILDRISDGGNGHGNMVMNWTSDTAENNPHVSGGDITRDKRKLAYQSGENDSTLTVSYVPAFPTAWKDGDPNTDEIRVCYRYSNPAGGAFGVPTFSPDGGAIAYHAGDGIHVAAVPAFGGDCTLDGATPAPPVVIPNGVEPDWGPADVPAARPAANTTPTTTNPTTKTNTTKPSLSVKVLAATRRAGIKLSVKVTGKGKLSATAKSGTKTVGKASATVKKPGTASLRLKVSRKGKLAVKITWRPTGGTAITKTITAKVN